MKLALVVLILCLMPTVALARSAVRLPVLRPLTLACVAEAAREHKLPLAALIGILTVEGGKVGEARGNSNGTWDLGPFQVNTCNVRLLAGKGFAPEALLADGCANARAAAWLLRREYSRSGNIWEAIGAYHSRTPHLRDAYIVRVRKSLLRLGAKGLEGLRP